MRAGVRTGSSCAMKLTIFAATTSQDATCVSRLLTVAACAVDITATSKRSWRMPVQVDGLGVPAQEFLSTGDQVRVYVEPAA